MGVLNGFATAGLDTFLRLNDRTISKQVVIVEITDEDYRSSELFGGKSPLDSKLLVKLVSAIQSYGPAVIGMDFDTESVNLPNHGIAALLKTMAHSPIVWAEVPCNIKEPLRLSPVLGGQLRDFTYIGIPRFTLDSDGLVRRYDGEFKVAGDFQTCPAKYVHVGEADEGTAEHEVVSRDSFANVVLYHACKDPNVGCPWTPQEKISGDRRARAATIVHHAFNSLRSTGGYFLYQACHVPWSLGRKAIYYTCHMMTGGCASVQDERKPSVIFNFFGDRYRFPIIQAHEFIGGNAEADKSNKSLESSRKTLLTDKIVLIGGSYAAARDVYMTPLGQMAGVELIALAIQSDFGGGIRETQKCFEELSDVLIGSLIVLLYFYYKARPRFAFVLSVVGVPIVGIVISFLLFRTTTHWFNFMPIIIGMVMHQMLELSDNCGDLQKEVHKLECEVRKLSKSRRHIEPPVIPPDVAPRQEKIEPPIGERPETKV